MHAGIMSEKQQLMRNKTRDGNLKELCNGWHILKSLAIFFKFVILICNLSCLIHSKAKAGLKVAY